MNSIFCRKSACIVVFSIITIACSFAQENDFFKQFSKQSFKDIIKESLKPETMMQDSLIENIKLDLNNELLFTDKKLLTVSENLLKPYTNSSNLDLRAPAIYNYRDLLPPQIYDNLSGAAGGINILGLIGLVVSLFLDTDKPKDDKPHKMIFTEFEKQTLIEKTNQLIRENRSATKSDPTP